MKKLLNKNLLYFMAAALLIFTACGFLSTTKAAGERVTLTIEGSQEMKTSSPEMFSQANYDAFQKKYPNIKIEQLLIPDTQQTSTLQMKLAAGEPSDLVIFNKVAAENELNAMKNFIDLSHQAWVKNLKQPDMLKAPNGKIYGWQMELPINAQGIVYNKEIFNQFNLSVPQKYDDFVKICETLKAHDITPLYGPFKDVWTFQIWTSGALGNYTIRKDPKLFEKLNANKLKWSDVKAFEDILQKGYDLVKKGYVQKSCLADDYNGAPAAFSSKKYAMMMMGDWFITDMQKKDPSLQLGLFPFPAFNDGTPLTLSQSQLGCVFFIPKKAKHIKEAKLFLNFMSEKAQVDNAQRIKNFLPNFKDAAMPSLDPLSQELVDKYVKLGKTSPEANSYVKVDMNELWKYYQDMIAGIRTPKDVLNAWDKKFTELMKSKGQPGF